MNAPVQKITLSSSRDIPFNKLLLSQSNVRRIKAGVSIEELAEDSGTTVRNIRVYQERGLLPPPVRRGRAPRRLPGEHRRHRRQNQQKHKAQDNTQTNKQTTNSKCFRR
jgi:hypothetical protein